MVAVGTNMSYVAIVHKSWEIILNYYRWLWKNWLDKKDLDLDYSLVLKKDVKQWSMIHIHWTASVRPAFGRSGQHRNHSQGSLTFLQKVIRIETLKKSQELRPWKKSQPQRTSLHHADFPSGSSLCIELVVALIANSDCTESFHFWTHSCPLQLSFHNWEEHSTFVYTQKFHFYAESVYSSICVQMYQRCAPWSVASPSHWLFRPQQQEFSGLLQKSDKGQFLYWSNQTRSRISRLFVRSSAC